MPKRTRHQPIRLPVCTSPRFLRPILLTYDSGLVIHHPDPDNKPPAPEYSLVRVSATATNQDWYQTNVSEENVPLPRWVERVRRHTTRLVPRLAAMEGLESDSDSEDMDDELMEDEVPMSQVHPHRFRFWGLAASPGDGCTAVLVTKHNTQHPYRRPRSRILFGQRSPTKDTTPGKQIGVAKKLTTEGRLWEACYGNQGDVSDIAPPGTADSPIHQNPLRDLFKEVTAQHRCGYCESQLKMSSQGSVCENGHSFGTSPSSQLCPWLLTKPLTSHLRRHGTAHYGTGGIPLVCRVRLEVP